MRRILRDLRPILLDLALAEGSRVP